MRLPRAALDRILSGQSGLDEETAAGAIELDGDPAALATLLGLLERPPTWFPIVTR